MISHQSCDRINFTLVIRSWKQKEVRNRRLENGFKRSNAKTAETTDDLTGIRIADRVTQITSQSIISKSKGPTQTDKNNIWKIPEKLEKPLEKQLEKSLEKLQQ